MSRIKSKDTAPELYVRSLLHRNGYRFRLHVKDLPGKPDIVLPKYKTVIGVRGCFWHQHPGCKDATMSLQCVDLWQKKNIENVACSKRAVPDLTARNWKSVLHYESQEKNKCLIASTQWRGGRDV